MKTTEVLLIVKTKVSGDSDVALWIKATLHSNQFSGNQTDLLAIASLMLYSTSLQYGGGTDAP